MFLHTITNIRDLFLLLLINSPPSVTTISQNTQHLITISIHNEIVFKPAKLIGTKNVEINSITVTNENVTVVLQNATLERMQTKHRSHDDRRR